MEERSVVVYNVPFEKSVLGKLAEAFPEHAGWIKNVKRRIIDLLEPFQKFHYYHPDQHGSASIKSVLPVLTRRSYAYLIYILSGLSFFKRQRFLELMFMNRGSNNACWSQPANVNQPFRSK